MPNRDPMCLHRASHSALRPFIAHITFNIPYVILSVMPKLKQTSRFTYVDLASPD